MANKRVDIISNEKQIQTLEDAHFVLLSLYREHSIKLLQNNSSKEDCITKMQQIKKDIKELSENELINKAKQIYLPLLHCFKKL